MTIKLLLRKCRSLIAAGPRRHWLVLSAIGHLFIARMSLLVMEWRDVAGRFGRMVGADDPAYPTLPDRPATDEARVAREIGWAVRSVAPFMPFRSVCLQQAMAAQAMLRRRGIASDMYFGVRQGVRPMETHAWLHAAGVRVTGYPMAEDIVPIGCFVPIDARPAH